MDGKDFAAWIEMRGLSDTKAARTLGLSRISVAKYKEEGAPVYIGLACAAIAFGLPPWRQVRHAPEPHRHPAEANTD